MPRDDRSLEAQAYRRLYNTARWKGKHGVRAQQLAAHPLCEMCLKAGRLTPATVCDHVDPKSKATEEGFFAGPFASLCDAEPWRCHSSLKQIIEERGFSSEVGPDGLPTDPNHPFNR
jgi:5-methylcytosine-specific restriction protein A